MVVLLGATLLAWQPDCLRLCLHPSRQNKEWRSRRTLMQSKSKAAQKFKEAWPLNPFHVESVKAKDLQRLIIISELQKTPTIIWYLKGHYSSFYK